jgi:predicted enzyme related to lactoylglutathione lyase
MRIVHFELPADDPARCMRFFGVMQFDPAAR